MLTTLYVAVRVRKASQLESFINVIHLKPKIEGCRAQRSEIQDKIYFFKCTQPEYGNSGKDHIPLTHHYQKTVNLGETLHVDNADIKHPGIRWEQSERHSFAFDAFLCASHSYILSVFFFQSY